MTNTQGKYWIFVQNNPTEPHEVFAQHFRDLPDFAYIAFQVEDPATRHYQGYVEFHKCKRFRQLQAALPGVHFERRKGTQQEAIDYCTLPEYKGKTKHRVDGPWTYGSPVATSQGKRTDLTSAIEILKEGGIKRVVEEHPETFAKYASGLFKVSSFIRPEKPVPEVYLLFGPSGCGKTKYFFDNMAGSDYWVLPSTDGFWFDGYYGQNSALLDELEGKYSGWKLTQLLRVLDRYPLQLPVKGGFTWWTPGYICITCNLHPREWYDYSERSTKFTALARRFTSVLWWKRLGSRPVVISNPQLDSGSGSDDLLDQPDLWDHFWGGSPMAQLALDKASGKLMSRVPDNYFDF